MDLAAERSQSVELPDRRKEAALSILQERRWCGGCMNSLLPISGKASLLAAFAFDSGPATTSRNRNPMNLPKTKCARSGDVRIAYQITGDGPFDVIWAPGTISHLDLE
jgi:hypothetical protein